MEIECPSHAIALWIEGDNLMIRFPDRQLVPIPATEFKRLETVLRARAEFARRKMRPSVATEAAPVAYDLEEATIKRRAAEERADAARAKKRDKRAKAAEKVKTLVEAEELLTLVGLA